MFDLRFDTAIPKGNFKVEYTTTTGKIYPLEIGYSSIPSCLVPLDAEATIKACRNGCTLYGRNGGCPPFSKKFSTICKKHFLVLYTKMLTEFYPPKVLNGPYYTRWVFVETFMTSLTNRIGKNLSSALDGYFLSSGHCGSCGPKRCAVKDGKPCRKPNARTYSLEATGILVTELMRNVFDIELQWWRHKEPDYVPKYMAKIVGLTREGPFEAKETEKAISEVLIKDRIVIYDSNTNIEPLLL